MILTDRFNKSAGMSGVFMVMRRDPESGGWNAYLRMADDRGEAASTKGFSGPRVCQGYTYIREGFLGCHEL
jgi:hypothetical protein